MSHAPDEVALYVHVPPDIAAALQDQQVDLVAILDDEGHRVRRGASPDPTIPAGTKDTGLVIIASGAALYLVGLAIVRIIKAVTGRTIVGELGELKPVVDGNGHPLHHVNGEPLVYWSKKKQILDPAQASKGGAAYIGVPALLEIEVRDQ
jgi:hypothetical protein